MKPNVASKQSRLNIFMPIAVFVDFFSTSTTRITKTMIVVQNIDEAIMEQCVDKGWDTKEDSGVICRIDIPTMSCKFMIPSQNFILTFYYRRWHTVGGRLVPLEQDMESFKDDPIIEIDIFFDNSLVFTLKIRGLCTLKQVQNDLLHEEIQLPQKYFFFINERKVHIISFVF